MNILLKFMRMIISIRSEWQQKRKLSSPFSSRSFRRIRIKYAFVTFWSFFFCASFSRLIWFLNETQNFQARLDVGNSQTAMRSFASKMYLYEVRCQGSSFSTLMNVQPLGRHLVEIYSAELSIVYVTRKRCHL